MMQMFYGSYLMTDLQFSLNLILNEISNILKYIIQNIVMFYKHALHEIAT